MSTPPAIPRFFQDLAPQWARLGLWQKKLTVVFERLRNSTVQKISASDEGFVILNLYRPGAPREPALISIQRTGSGISFSNAKPTSQNKPNSIVQVARKYLQGRRIEQVLLCLDPVAVIIEFAAPGGKLLEEQEWTPDSPNCIIIDLDSRPARVCVATKHSSVPNRYADQCSGFESGGDFFESHCEWSLENTKTKRRATFTHPLVTSCIVGGEASMAANSVSDTASAASIGQETEKEDFFQTEISKFPQPVTAGAESQNFELIKPSVTQQPEMNLQFALNLLPTHVRRAARTRLQFFERRLQRQKTDLPVASVMDNLKRRAEGLRAHIYMWPKDFPQWHVPPEIIESAGLPAILTLKHGQSPGDLVTAAFDELDKLARRRNELEKRIEESRLALERFADQIIQAGADIFALPEEVRSSRLALARDVQHLVTVQRILTQLEVSWSPVGEKQSAMEAERERRLPYRSFRATSGEFIRVSKSAADADAMLKLMPAHHTWVHVMTGEGSHVWLEKPKGAKPSDTALREAAILAIHHSKQTRAQEADVYVALRADLDKRKDLPPGKVLVRRSEHRFVRYSQMELQAFMEKQGS
ncbi:MAG: NFACT RNA binding domain-containing protein [Silvanigrellaceae bacterium]